jgi:hypothetical protein
MIRARALVAAAIAGCAVACSLRPGDSCPETSRCIELELDAIPSHTIDQVTLDVVYGGVHDTLTIDAVGGAIRLPTTIPLTFDVADTSLLEIGIIAAGKLNGRVVGADARSTRLQQGDHDSLLMLLFAVEPCTETAVYCGGTLGLQADFQTLYRCTGGLPTYYARCSTGCFERTGQPAQCFGLGPCVDGGTYCGGNKLDGDPNTLYVCKDRVGTAPRLCPNGCRPAGIGLDACI